MFGIFKIVEYGGIGEVIEFPVGNALVDFVISLSKGTHAVDM